MASENALELNFNHKVGINDLPNEQRTIVNSYPEKMTDAQFEQIKTWLQEVIATQAKESGIEVKFQGFLPCELAYSYSYTIAFNIEEYQDKCAAIIEYF